VRAGCDGTFWGMKLGGGGGDGKELNEGKAGSAGALRAKLGTGEVVGGRGGG
jgi:hypothetical protein